MKAEERLNRNQPRDSEGPPKPDVLVGIDIGTTFTKVAYALHLNNDYVIRDMQDWSGFGYANGETDAVDTILAYPTGESLLEAQPSRYGRLKIEERHAENLDVYEWFKRDFPGALGSHENPGIPFRFAENADSTDTMVLYRHFMAKLRVAIKNEISAKLKEHGMPQWKDAHIDFIFSVPATWTGIEGTLRGYTSKFEDVLRLVHFKAFPRHNVCIGITEPEATAAFSMVTEHEAAAASNKTTLTSYIPKAGESILVVDAGGGTTDLCLLHVLNTNGGMVKIDNMIVPSGENVGSSHIDRMFEQLAVVRLKELSEEINPVEDWDFVQLSQAMRCDPSFEAAKKTLSAKLADSFTHFTVLGPDLSKYPESNTNHRVVNGRIKFTYRELAALFDDVIDDTMDPNNENHNRLPGINRLIQRARNRMRIQGGDSPRDVDVILLSGGLGQSEYLKHRVEKALQEDQDPNQKPKKIPMVITVAKAQLSVCRGLLHDRIRKIFVAQKCNANYGILVESKFRYLRLGHLIAWAKSQITERGHRTFVKEVKWMAEKGRTIPSTPPKHLYTFEKKDDRIVRIVVSNDDKPGILSNPNRDDIIEVDCNRWEPAYDPKTKKRYCEVEFIFGIGKFDVKCWSPAGEDRRLIGQCEGIFAVQNAGAAN